VSVKVRLEQSHIPQALLATLASTSESVVYPADACFWANGQRISASKEFRLAKALEEVESLIATDSDIAWNLHNHSGIRTALKARKCTNNMFKHKINE
jgi:hypothetical protein